jgi:hypothetical protein
MIIPEYWAEARLQQGPPLPQITVRRFGWSDISQAEAMAHAESRAKEALERIATGEKLRRRERRAPYGGAEGLPIREEIVRRHGETIITRNVYGALCLNTPDVLFADIDEDVPWKPGKSCLIFLVVFLIAAFGIGFFWIGKWQAVAALMALALVLAPMASGLAHRLAIRLGGGMEKFSRHRIDRAIAERRDWRFRLYRTPLGFRVLATHRTFDPRSAEVAEFFAATGTDPQYAAMCRAQNCFRARVTPKPWRIGMHRRIPGGRGTWPVKTESLPAREAWLREYESLAEGHAACAFIGEFGDVADAASTRAVQSLHDQLCKAESGLPVA